MEDSKDIAISRQATIDVMCELMHHWFGGDPKDEIREIKRELEKLPSAQPEQSESEDITFWKKRAREYEEMVLKLTDEMARGIKVDSVLITEEGIVFKKKNPEQLWIPWRWIPCGKCIHADGKHRWCKVLDRTINEDDFCCWAEPWKEGEAEC